MIVSETIDKAIGNYTAVIPYYNGKDRLLLRAIESVKSQTVKPEAIIIVNDGSDKVESQIELDTIQRIHSDIMVFTLKTNSGVATARNIGIYNSTTKYIAFLDYDDEWFPNKMESQLKILESNNGYVACGCKVDSDGRNLLRSDIEILTVFKMLTRHYIQTSTFVAKREFLTMVNGFQNGRRYAEEGDLYLKISLIGNIAFLNEVLVRYSSGRALNKSPGLSSNKFKMFQGEIRNIYAAYKRRQISIILMLFFTLLTSIRFSIRFIKS